MAEKVYVLKVYVPFSLAKKKPSKILREAEFSGNSYFRTLFAILGPKGPNDPCGVVRGLLGTGPPEPHPTPRIRLGSPSSGVDLASI